MVAIAKTTRPQRATRKPLHQRGPLSISGEKDSDFADRLGTDRGSRISNHQEAGWEFVEDANLVVGDSRVKDVSDMGTSKRVTSDDGTIQFLMKIKKEYYEEDRATKQAQVDEQMRALQTDASGMGYGSIKQT